MSSSGNGTFGVGDELDELVRGVTRLAFGDIGRNGDRGAAHLRNQTELLIGGQFFGEKVDLAREGDAFLPNNEITIPLRFGIAVLVTRHKSHVTWIYLSLQIDPSP